METKKAIFKRHAVRHFSDQKISDDDVNDIVNTAKQAPSWIDAQETRIYAVSGNLLNQMKQKHAQLNHQKQVYDEPAFSALPIKNWDETSQKNMNNFIKVQQQTMNGQGHEKESDNLFYAPVVLYLTLPQNHSKWSILDIGILVQNIMVAAADKGIDSMPAFEFVKYVNHLDHALELAPHEQAVMAIGLGYADSNYNINKVDSPRMSNDQLLTFKK